MDPDQILDEVEEFVTGVRPQPATSRVLASILFSDVVRSTETARKLGDEPGRSCSPQHDRAFADVLERFGGELVDTAGDGVLALFDGPARAIRCGLAVRDHLTAFGLEVRVGIHTGEIERQKRSCGGSRCTWLLVWQPRPKAARSWSPRRPETWSRARGCPSSTAASASSRGSRRRGACSPRYPRHRLSRARSRARRRSRPAASR